MPNGLYILIMFHNTYCRVSQPTFLHTVKWRC